MRHLYAFVCRSAWLRPSLADMLLVSLVVWLFVAGQGWTVLLADGDTGWHIRAGDWILQTHSVPTRDLFSFSRAGEPWYAWEWLSDVLFAVVHRHWGLAGVVALCGCVLAATALVLCLHMLWRGANGMVALPVVLLAVSASSIHFLARPHIFTLLLLAGSLWVVERDRRQPSPWVWLLAPASAVWVNLHGGFFALPACLAALAGGLAIEGWMTRERRAASWSGARRYAVLCGATAAASLVNPYGIGLHRHIWSYLTSDWIRNTVDEFQSPRFRSENLLHFELLLAVGLMLAGSLLARRRVADALLLLVWAHLALGSARHVPLFAVVASPIVAVELSRLWEQRVPTHRPRAVARLLWALGRDLGSGLRRVSVWSAILAGGAILLTPASRWPGDFPQNKFPVVLVQAEGVRLKGSRLFTPDQWGDYLIYHNWPAQRVFIDGRSDFYGRTLGLDYLRLAEGRPGWDNLFRKYGFTAALVPRDWPLAGLLERASGWSRVRADPLAVLFERTPARADACPNQVAAPDR